MQSAICLGSAPKNRGVTVFIMLIRIIIAIFILFFNFNPINNIINNQIYLFHKNSTE